MSLLANVVHRFVFVQNFSTNMCSAFSLLIVPFWLLFSTDLLIRISGDNNNDAAGWRFYFFFSLMCLVINSHDFHRRFKYLHKFRLVFKCCFNCNFDIVFETICSWVNFVSAFFFYTNDFIFYYVTSCVDVVWINRVDW